MKHELGDAAVAVDVKRMKREDTPLEQLSGVDEPFSQQDVVYYQKEAIYRQWHLQFGKNRRLRARMDRLQAKYDNVFGYYQLLTKWWNEIVDNLKTVSVLEGFNDDMLLPVEAVIQSKPGESTFDELVQLRKELIELITPLFKNVPSGSQANVIEVNKSLADLKVIKDKLLNENDDLKANVNDLNDQVDSLIRKLDREQSATLTRLKAAAGKEEAVEEPRGSSAVQDVAAATTVAVSSEVNDQTLHELEDLKIKLADFEAKVKFLNERLDEKVAKISELETSLQQSKQQSPLEQHQQQLQPSADPQLNTKISNLEISKKKLEVQIAELEASLTISKTKFEQKSKSEIEQGNALIKKLEQDVNRLRTERDTSLTKLNILKSEKSSNELIDHYKALVDTLQERVTTLESQQETKFNELSKDEMTNILTNELKQMEVALKKTRELANSKINDLKEYQVIINKLQVEKTKADEKYFQAMRTNDASANQNKILQANINKQKDLIEILRDEKQGLQKKLEIETKLFEKLNAIEELYKNDLSHFKSRLEKAESAAMYESNKAKNLQNDIGALQKEKASLSKTIQSLEEQVSGFNAKCQKMEVLVNKYRTNSRTEEDEEINQALLNMTKCQLCTKNFKDVALKTCGHCFCMTCVDDRLNSRMRKCPSCNSQFSRYDLLNIHL